MEQTVWPTDNRGAASTRYGFPAPGDLSLDYDENDDGNDNDNNINEMGEASGRDGKMLGRALGVNSVPTFILFRKGKPFGKPISVNRLPSEKLETAINYLKEGVKNGMMSFLLIVCLTIQRDATGLQNLMHLMRCMGS
jgi:hypothetical protein